MKPFDTKDDKISQAAELRQKAERRLGKKKKDKSAKEPAESDILSLVHELQVHQIELEMQNEELLRANASVQEISSKYADLFNFAPVGYFSWDGKGRILEINLAGAAMLGLVSSAAINTRFAQYVAREDLLVFADFCNRVLSSDQKQTCEIALQRGDRRLQVIIEGIAAKDSQEQGDVCRAAVIDITERKRMEEDLRRYQAHLEEMVEQRTSDLKIRNIQLSAEMADRKRAEAETVELATFPRLNPCPITEADFGGEIHFMNPAAERLFKDLKQLKTAHPWLADWDAVVRIFREGSLDVHSRMVAVGETFYQQAMYYVKENRRIRIYGMDITEIHTAQKESNIAVEFLDLVNRCRRTRELIQVVVTFFQHQSGCEAVGIRLKEGSDFPYLEARGFPEEFVALENSLCLRDCDGKLVRDSGGNPILECICGNVIGGRFDASKPFYTPHGSFWTNSTTELLSEAAEADEQARNRCYGEGYESIALIPLQIGDERIGLLQLNDRRKGLFSPDIISLWERLAGQFAVAIGKFRAEDALRESQMDLNRAQAVAQTGSWRLNLTSNELFWSDETYKIFGIPKGTPLTYETFLSAIHPDDRKYVDRKWKAALGGKRYDVEHRIIVGNAIKWVHQTAELEFDEAGKLLSGFGTAHDITARKQREARIVRLTKLYAVLSQINEAIVRIHSEESLYDAVCRIIAEEGEFPLVWIGQVENREVVPVASCGKAVDYLKEIKVEIKGELGKGPTGACIREDRSMVNDDFDHNSLTVPWRKAALHYGFRASAAFPLHRQGAVVGALTLYAVEPNIFDAEQVRLLEALSADISYALDAMQQERLRSRAEAALRDAKEAAEAANAAKSQFLANVSHDLRTPMNAVLGMTDLALEEEISPLVRDHLETVKGSAHMLLELLNEVLDLSRMEAGKFRLDSASFNLRTTFEETIKFLRMQAAENGLQLICDLAYDLPDILQGDPLRIRQILINLVGNAIKFTEHGAITIRAEVQSRSEKEVVLQFVVEDTGIGISLEDQEKIFAPFIQADSSTSRNFGGTGLGLTIVANLVEMMGGKIWVESQPGIGSKFYFTVRFGIPSILEEPPESAAKEDSAISESPAWSYPLRILLAEDNPGNQKVATYMLAKHGHSVKVAHNGREALEKVQQEDFDIILMDVQMATMDGFQATSAIRALEDRAKAGLPIIAMTAFAMKEDRERCLAAGMNGYITKPINARELIALIERLGPKDVRRKASEVSEPEVSEPAEETSPIPATSGQSDTNIFNLDEAVTRCFERYNLFQDMIGCLFDESDMLFGQMRMGLDNRDADEVGKAVHRLKGTVAFLAAPSAMNAIERIEYLCRKEDLGTAGEAIDQLQEQIQLLKEAVAEYCKKDK